MSIFLSRNKSSCLLSVDDRVDAFLRAISASSDNFTVRGIKRLINECYDDLINDRL